MKHTCQLALPLARAGKGWQGLQLSQLWALWCYLLCPRELSAAAGALHFDHLHGCWMLPSAVHSPSAAKGRLQASQAAAVTQIH